MGRVGPAVFTRVPIAVDGHLASRQAQARLVTSGKADVSGGPVGIARWSADDQVVVRAQPSVRLGAEVRFVHRREFVEHLGVLPKKLQVSVQVNILKCEHAPIVAHRLCQRKSYPRVVFVSHRCMALSSTFVMYLDIK